VADDDGRTSVHDGQEVVDMALETLVEGQNPTRPVVAAAVVDDRVEVVESPDDAGETVGPVEGAVDQNHHRCGVRGSTAPVFGDGQRKWNGHRRSRLTGARHRRHTGP
jgi:hypothetical protein